MEDLSGLVFVLFVGQRKCRLEFTLVQRTDLRFVTRLLLAEVIARYTLGEVKMVSQRPRIEESHPWGDRTGHTEGEESYQH